MSSTPPPVFIQPGPPPALPERPEGLPPLWLGADRWKPWTAWLVIVLALTVPLVLGIVVGVGIAIGGGDISDGKLPAEAMIGLTFVQQFGFVAAPLVLAGLLVGLPRSRDFGIAPPPRFWAAVGILGGVYIAFALFSAAWVSALGIDEQDSLLNDLGVKDSSLHLWLVLVMVTVGAPVAEELLFRGYMYRALRNWKGVWPAALLSGLAFGGIHVGSSPVGFLVPLAVFGIGLALLYHWTQSLYFPVALHAFNNAVAFGVSQDWDWQIAPTIVGAVVVSLSVLWALGRVMDRRAARQAPAGLRTMLAS